MSRPLRLVKSQKAGLSGLVQTVATDIELFQNEEEHQLHSAFLAVQPYIYESMPVREFLSACDNLSSPMAAYFDKVSIALIIEHAKQRSVLA